MDFNIVLTNLFGLIAGVGVYMIACSTISKNLEAVSSDGLKKLLARVSENRLLGVAIGALATILIQSSSATTVMTIGFVNAGIISLKQAATIIFGGEVGTTITGQIVALGLFKTGTFDVSVIFSAFAGIGVAISMIAKKDSIKRIGDIISGFGILFIGLNMMSSSMNTFAQMDALKVFLANINNTIILIIAGAIITAIIHSSAAMTSIAITMVAANLITLEQGIYITLGANVGTCFTGAMAAMSSSTNAKRTSLIQLIFNAGGVLLLLIVDTIIKIVTGNSFSIGILFERMFEAPHLQLAMFHTIFNIVSVLIVLPITNYLVKLTQKIIPDADDDQSKEKFYFVDDNMLSTPSVAVSQVKKEIINMSKIAIDNFNTSIDIITSLDFSKKQDLLNNEDELNFLNRNLVSFIVKLTGSNGISRKDYLYLTSTYRAISDLERIGDYSTNILEYAENLKEYDEKFTEDAISEIEDLRKLINELYTYTIKVYTNDNRKDFKKAQEIEDEVDDITFKMADNHIIRLNKGVCTANAGAQYLKLSSDSERIGDHLINIIDKNYEIIH